jgi:hypothetical protein
VTDCEHRTITTLVFASGEPAGQVAMWMCADCRRKFAPMNVKAEDAMQLALEALKNGRRVREHDSGTKFQPPLEDAAIDALTKALGEE